MTLTEEMSLLSQVFTFLIELFCVFSLIPCKALTDEPVCAE